MHPGPSSLLANQVRPLGAELAALTCIVTIVRTAPLLGLVHDDIILLAAS
jgi:hypothetical protein